MKLRTMRLLIQPALALFLCLTGPVFALGGASGKAPGKNAILLSKVNTLTLRDGHMTTSRRVSPIPQLHCTGPSKRICDLYTIETMRCTNAGYDYDEEDVQWTCTASLPPEFKLGSTDVVCEGYRSAEDKWVLKGSCGVEYRLLLTDLGEQRLGKIHKSEWSLPSSNGWRKTFGVLGDLLFFGFMIAAFVMIIIPMLRNCLGLQRNRREGNPRRGWGGFWGGGGGGGGGGGNYPPGPPPPYNGYSDCGSSTPRAYEQGWRPGFWTGALGGAMAGYQMGRNRTQDSRPARSWTASSSSRSSESSSRAQNSPSFSASTTGTGFGSTRRR
ncbi:hypothetical protein ASPZODRAFT_863408 [Penicilliopsis zonata CBS 506.65]|uniref:Store-operated calcium entry-associated regulatory factor n=1 Tax=Penicilliopsis zonata CBS 506.65 TaxID=1073090 RepID=A0A1L9S9B7_9EURO|nr:hypothetical protein ASPZODRAFT_863408 [Penicilliopsis zonata CBS 506.65]OJJ43756.1 hypothetical protein ASPZODRAFT_863408 [Penicilliopsis zonata CBS 506.65]